MPAPSLRLLILLACSASLVGAQSTPPDSVRTTLGGVYSEDQAAKGKDVFLGHCQSCHTAADFTSSDFKADWVGKMLGEFFAFLKETMPESEPGALSNEQYASVTAYILQLNGLPSGATPLPASADSLGVIKIEVAPPGLAMHRRQVLRPARDRYHLLPRAAIARGNQRQAAALAPLPGRAPVLH